MGLRIKIPKADFLIIPILIILLLSFVYWHGHRNLQTKTNKNLVSATDLANGQVTDATNEIKTKDYAAAMNSYLAAAAADQSKNDYKSAKSVLADANKKIPEQYLTYLYYESLAGVDLGLGNKQDAKLDFQKAIEKAKLPNSGATQDQIMFYTDQINRIK